MIQQMRSTICVAAFTLTSALLTAISFAQDAEDIAPLAEPVTPQTLDSYPQPLRTVDHPWDDGTAIDVYMRIPDLSIVQASEYLTDDDPKTYIEYVLERAGEQNGVYTEIARVAPTLEQLSPDNLEIKVTSDKHIPGEPGWFRFKIVQNDGTTETSSEYFSLPDNQPGLASRQYFDGGRAWLAIITLIVCGSVVTFILLARRGMPLKIRTIAGLEAIEEAVGRATEMGRACLYVPGIQDMNDIQTIAGLTILSRVAEQAAEYDCLLETPTSKSLVMTAARETVATAFLKAGRPDAYNEDLIYYVTDEQFAYVSFLTGKMVREKPAACFYLGAFFAESLILAETGNSIGAIQVAGTAQPAQLPFFVAACDYTLIGEEFFAASAYLSDDPDQLGSLKGQDVGKLIVGGMIVLGVVLLTTVELTGSEFVAKIATYVMDTVLQSA